VRRRARVLGALSVAFGVPSALLALLGLAFALYSPPAPDLTAAQHHYQIASTATFFVMAIALVVIGFGLLFRKRWSRAAGIVWAIVAIAVVEFEFYLVGELGASRTWHMMVTLVIETTFPMTMLLLLARRPAQDDFI